MDDMDEKLRQLRRLMSQDDLAKFPQLHEMLRQQSAADLERIAASIGVSRDELMRRAQRGDFRIDKSKPIDPPTAPVLGPRRVPTQPAEPPVPRRESTKAPAIDPETKRLLIEENVLRHLD